MRDLLYGCWCGGKRVGGVSFPPVPLAQLATVVRDAGIPASVIDAAAERVDLAGIARRMRAGDLLFLMSSPLSIEADIPFLRRVRESAGVRTVLFGAYPTFRPGEAVREDGVDFIIRGEPECASRTLAELLAAGAHPGPQQVPGVGCRGDAGCDVPADFAAEPDLDKLPVADRRLIPGPGRYFNPVVRDRRFTTAFTSRGCFGRCTFCSAGTFHRGGARYRSADSVIEELRDVAELGFREVFFRDELFTGDRRRLIAICEGMRARGFRLGWICSSRVDRIDAELAVLMKSAGCHLVRMGVESGSQAVLDRIRKGISLDDTRAAFAACRRAGIDTHAHTMVGMPGETYADFRMTIALIREIRPTYLTMSVCTPFPGTPLFEELERSGATVGTPYLARNIRDGLHSVPIHNHLMTAMTPSEVRSCLGKAYRDFYFRWNGLFRQLASLRSFAALPRKIRAGVAVARVATRRG